MILNVMSEKEAGAASYKLYDKTAIISVRNPGEPPLDFCESNNLLAVKTLNFADTAQVSAASFSMQHALEIAEFLRTVIGKADRLIVHCEFGVSRSAGIAAAILEVLTGDSSPVFGNPWFVPNMLCFRLTCEALHAGTKPLICKTDCEFRDNVLGEDIQTMEKNKIESGFVSRFSEICKSLGCPVEVLDYREGESGVSLDIKPCCGKRIEEFLELKDDVALQLGAYYIRIIPPGNGSWKLTVNVLNERPVQKSSEECAAAINAEDARLPLCLGFGITGEPVMLDIGSRRAVLVAGPESDTSDFIRSADSQMRMSDAWNNVRLVHTGGSDAYGPIARYCLMIEDGEDIPETVLFIDRYEELLRVHGDDAEDMLFRLLTSRDASALHLFIVTSSPMVDVVTGIIKNNVSASIAFHLDDSIRSRTVINTAGAECLAGKGEALLVTDTNRHPVWFILPKSNAGKETEESHK